MLGYLNEYGVGVTKDVDKARMWLERAASSGDPGAELELGCFLSNCAVKASGVAVDKARALSLFEAAASQHYPKAETFLANALLNGTLGASDGRRDGRHWRGYTDSARSPGDRRACAPGDRRACARRRREPRRVPTQASDMDSIVSVATDKGCFTMDTGGATAGERRRRRLAPLRLRLSSLCFGSSLRLRLSSLLSSLFSVSLSIPR